MFEIRNVKFGEGMPVIAVPIIESDEEAICASAQLANGEADLIEFRADAFAGIQDTKRMLGLLADLTDIFEGPILFTLRTEREGGLLALDAEQYLDILRIAISSGCIDLIDIELGTGLAAEAEAYGMTTAAMLAEEAHEFGVRVVMSRHDFGATPGRNEILKTLAEMQNNGADLAKAAYMPTEENDVNEVLEAGLRAKWDLDIPAALISMGDRGALTRTHGEVFGSAMTFACQSGRASAPGQIEAADLRAILEDIHERIEKEAALFIIGFMGVGKTSVAREIGEKSGFDVIEMDEKIEEEQGMPIAEIFSEHGEQYFRGLETEFLKSLVKEDGCVVSCGGGTVLRAENIVRMKGLGKIVLLTAKPETVYERLQGEAEERPILSGRFTPEGIANLQEERREYYMEAQDVTIATDDRTIADIANEIINIIGW